MLFISTEDFFTQAKGFHSLAPEEERQLARQMEHDPAARERLICSYLPHVAGRISHMPKNLQTLQTVYACLDTLEKGVDSFDFQQDHETFSHHLSWRLRQCTARCIANR